MSHSCLLEILVPASSSSSSVRHTYVVFKHYTILIPRENKVDMYDAGIYLFTLLLTYLLTYSSFSDDVVSLGYMVSDDRTFSE
jgi:hypothetical protein